MNLLVLYNLSHESEKKQKSITHLILILNPVQKTNLSMNTASLMNMCMRLSDFTFTFHFQALEKEMATHSSVLAWRMPGTGEPGGCRLWGRTELDTTEVT